MVVGGFRSFHVLVTTRFLYHVIVSCKWAIAYISSPKWRSLSKFSPMTLSTVQSHIEN